MEVWRIESSRSAHFSGRPVSRSHFGTVFAFVFEQRTALHLGFWWRFRGHFALGARLNRGFEHTRLGGACATRRPTAPVSRVHIDQRRVIRRQRVVRRQQQRRRRRRSDLLWRPGRGRRDHRSIRVVDDESRSDGTRYDGTAGTVQFGLVRQSLTVLWRGPVQGRRVVGRHRFSKRQYRAAVGRGPRAQVVVDRLTQTADAQRIVQMAAGGRGRGRATGPAGGPWPPRNSHVTGGCGGGPAGSVRRLGPVVRQRARVYGTVERRVE